MTLLTVVLAAVACTVLWYRQAPRDEMRLSVLCLMYWGAALMWLVDAVAGYAELGAAVFSPAPADVLDDLCLGLSAVALGLVIWLAVVLVGDPDGRVRASLGREGRSGGATE